MFFLIKKICVFISLRLSEYIMNIYFALKQELLNFKITLSLAKLDLVSSRLVSLV